MKKEVKENDVILDGFHAKELNYIELSLQDEKATEEAIKYNKANNYKYKFIANNMINTKCLLPLLRNGYKLSYYTDFIFKDDVIIIYHD